MRTNELEILAQRFCEAVVRQREEELLAFFAPGAQVCWHCSNERFTAKNYVRANCAYPGSWKGEVERVEPIPGGMAAIMRVWMGDASFHTASFFRLTSEGKIAALDEYFGDDGEAPEWRRKMGVATPLR